MKYVLAPLADFTDAPFRKMCFLGGADGAYTEMVSAAALYHSHRGTLRLLEKLPGEGPLACQLFGANEEELAFAAAAATATGRFTEINLNAGCPMARITRVGAGSKLIETPDRIYSLLKAIKSATDLPVTLKTRPGPRPGKSVVFELVDAAERAGASGIILHGRHTSEMHGGQVHFDIIADVVSRTRLHVTGNGGVKDARSAGLMAQTGVGAVMIGRAALAAPSIFSRLKGEECALSRDPVELCRMHLGFILDFHSRLKEKFPADHMPSRDAFAAIRMHVHLFRYFSGLPGAAAMRGRLSRVRSVAEIEEEMKKVRDVSG